MYRSLNESPLDQLNPSAVTIDNTVIEARVLPVTIQAANAPRFLSRFCDVSVDRESAALWVRLKASAPRIFSPALIEDLRQVHGSIESQRTAQRSRHQHDRARYQVLASSIPGVFSLGGDLALFRECITSGNAHALARYAQDAVSLVHACATAYDSEVTTIALVQGQALGGGFEAALASQVFVAERSARMAFPEVLFNMFPGMGAFQLLQRRLSAREAEQMIFSGRTYSAMELHALGVVDVLAEDGEGEAAVRQYIRSHDRQHHGRQGFRRALQAAAPLDLDALRRMADIWVDTAMGLTARDLDTIDYLLRAQRRQVEDSAVRSDAQRARHKA